MFVSISLDLVGSTPLKRAMFRYGNHDFEKINRLYELYVQNLFEIEESFYRYVCESGVVDIRKLFLVKIIGDEYWFVYDVNDDDTDELRAVGNAFIYGLLEVLAKPRRLSFGDKNVQTKFDFDLSLKALIDLVTNALHLPDRRYAHFENKIMGLLGSEARLSEVDPGDYAALCYGLNFRPARPISQELLGVTRSDYVGMQIDRFFRTAKACKPRLVSVGSTLWEKLGVKLTQPRPKVGVYLTGCEEGIDVQFAGKCIASRETIPAREMTGIDHDYEVWHLYSKHTLRDEIYLPDKDLIDYLASTRAFLAREGFYGIDRAGA
jgi:hypothetical protein